MTRFASEARNFRARQNALQEEAAQRAALSLICGIDLDKALHPDADRPALIKRVERGLRAERVKGLRHHWRYDLNRHIALKQALDRLRNMQALG